MFLIYIFQTKTKSDFGVSQNPICLRSETSAFQQRSFSIALVFYFEVVALFKCCSGVFLYSGHCLYDPVLFKRGGDAVTVVVEGHFIGHYFDFF